MRLQLAGAPPSGSLGTLFSASFPTNITGWTAEDVWYDGASYALPDFAFSSSGHLAAGSIAVNGNDWVGTVKSPVITGVQPGDVLAHSAWWYNTNASEGAPSFNLRYYSDAAGTVRISDSAALESANVPQSWQSASATGRVVPPGTASIRYLLSVRLSTNGDIRFDEVVVTGTRP